MPVATRTVVADPAGVALGQETAEEALGRVTTEQMARAYRAHADYLRERQPGAAHPYGLETAQRMADVGQQAAVERLRNYDRALHAFLDTGPEPADLSAWLAHRAQTDAAVWARQDALTARRQAVGDFYAINRPPEGTRFAVLPSSAQESRCAAIAGRVFDSYAEAADALGGAAHRGCRHYVDPVDY